MSHQTLEYEAILRAAGHRVTQQRLIILDAVCAGHGHTTLGEIYTRAHAVDPSLDRSTLYRMLKLFIELGLVVSAEVSGETYYEIARPQRHHHLICRRCGCEQEIEQTAVQGMGGQPGDGRAIKVHRPG